jgi:lipopolysaccharide transport system ATP-binding protein
LLEEGVVAADGRPEEVVGRYLASGSGSAAERVWVDTERPPGDAIARMSAVRVVDRAGATVEAVDVGDLVVIEIDYWKLQQGGRPVAALQFFNEEGVCLFASSAFGPSYESALPTGVGLVRARCKIPPHLLAEGRVFVLAAVVSYNPDRVHALERDAVSFQVVDRRGADGFRERYAADWPGVVRPVLEWQVDTERESLT